MPNPEDDLSNALGIFRKYAESQRDFIEPEANIEIETGERDATKVHIDMNFADTNLHFESIETKDTDDFHNYLNQPVVRALYSNGKTPSYPQAVERVQQLAERYSNKDSDLYLYSGFVVTDNNEAFLGVCNLGGSSEDGATEVAYLNRADSWSNPPADIVNEYAVPAGGSKLKKQYKGIATAEICTLIQYAARLKKDGYKVKGQELKAVVATARIDNEGSWKAAAKAGMDVTAVDVNPAYGPFLRYQLRKPMR